MAEIQAEEALQHDIAPADILSEDGTEAISEENETEPEKDLGKAPSNENKKEIPDPAPVNLVKRSGRSTASATKPTVVSVSRTGGLSKPPTRAPVVSSTRKSTSNTMTPGHTRSAPSTGGSGDEKKRIPASTTARRTSLASTGTYHSPAAKTETLIEKRGVPTNTTGRKPPTSVSSASPKPSAAASKSTNNTIAKSASSSKPSASGSASDAKKRLSAISGSASLSKPSARVVAQSPTATSNETEKLKAKIAESETRVIELQNEIKSAEGKLLEIGKQLKVEGLKAAAANEEINKQHNELIEKLHAKHKVELEELQAELREVELDKTLTQESSTQAIEEAQQMTARNAAEETAAVLQKLEAEYKSAMAALDAELASTKEAHRSLFSTVAEKQSEIETLKAQVSESTEKLEALKSEHQNNLVCLEKSLADQHEAALSSLKEVHATEIAREAACIASNHENEILEITKKYESIVIQLQGKINDVTAAHAALEASHKRNLEIKTQEHSESLSKLDYELTALKSKLEADSVVVAKSFIEIEELKRKNDSAEKDLIAAQEEITTISEKFDVLETKNDTNTHKFLVADAELSQAKSKIDDLKSLIDDLRSDGNSKDEANKKTQEQLEFTSKTLDEKKEEILLLHEKHQKELQTVSFDYQTEIDALQGNPGIREEFESMKFKYQELSKVHEESLATHSKTLDQVKQDHSASITALEDKEALHSKELEKLDAAHQKSISEAYDRAITSSNSTHASELEALQATHKEAMAALQMKLLEHQDVAFQTVETLKTAQAALQTELEESKDALIQNQAELASIRQVLDLEKLEKVSVQAKLDATQNEKQDNTEVDGLRQQLQALEEKHHASLITVQEESTRVAEEYAATQKALEDLQAELTRQKVESTSDYNNLSESMTQLLEEANKKVADTEARLKEAEAHLKVKDAEITEAKTKNFLKGNGLAASIYADTPSLSAEVMEGEQESSSTALKSLAQASFAAQQLVQMNEDLRDENIRSLQSITSISPMTVAITGGDIPIP